MPMTTEHAGACARTSPGSLATADRRSPGRAIRKVMDRLKAARQHRIATQHLMQLSNHTLKDIGIDRSEIVSLLSDTTGERRRSSNRKREGG